MLEEGLALRAEADELHAFLRTLDAADWDRPTPFKGWTPWDVVAHLHFSDRLALLAFRDPEAFATTCQTLLEGVAAGSSATEHTRRALGDPSASQLLRRWYDTCLGMVEEVGAADPRRRVPWVGPDMGVRTFLAARYMETWAHGQDVYDLKRAARTHSDRIRYIAALGVKTFGWTFANRGLPVPNEVPHVRLDAPSGAVWEWNEPSARNRISGSAVDFCRVVCQVRNVADTDLDAVGDVATQWMAIAQCFAGPPADPPKPGERVGAPDP